jgi:DNA-binding IclR family transcriptional regulator
VTRVVERVGRILDAFTPERPELALVDFVHATDLNKTSAYRLLVSLEGIGLVERTDSLWRLGPKTITLSSVRLGRIDLRRDAMPHLRELRRVFRAAVAFSLPEGSEMIYVERLDSPDAVGVSARLGGRAPIWAGGSGKAVLAHLEQTELDHRLDVEEWRRLPRDVRDRALDLIERTRELGYCVDPGEFFSGIGGVAVAVCEAHGDPVAALSVIVPGDQLTDRQVELMADRLLASAAELEAGISSSQAVPTPASRPRSAADAAANHRDG